MDKKAIAVYDPSDSWERAIQDAAKEYTGQWLSMYRCQLVAKAVASLKSIDNWMSDVGLLTHRAKYFFAPQFASNKNELVFVTHLLFLRDVLENREVNSYVYDPIVFMTRPLAHYLFREYPIHILVDYDLLKSENSGVNFIEVGGLVISDGEDVKLDESIIDISSKHTKNLDFLTPPEVVNNIRTQTGLKAAARAVSRGIFQIDDHERFLVPDRQVWDKEKRADATIYLVEPGDTGLVGLRYDDGTEITISKLFFDSRYTLV
jgi:hypothetical protein